MKRSIQALGLVLLALVGTCAFADSETPRPEINQFLASWRPACKAMAGESLSDPNLAPVLRAFPTTPDEICACVEAKMRADKYLHILMEENNADALKGMDKTNWRLYIRGKGASFTLACNSIAIERAADAIYPGNAP